MKIRTHSLITPLCATIASLLIMGSPAQAGYIATLKQVGPNVVANGSGALDLTGLVAHSGGGVVPYGFIVPSQGAFAVGVITLNNT